MSQESLKEKLVEGCRWIGFKGYFPGSSGNATILDEERRWVYITATERRKTELKTTDVIVLDLDGNVVEGKGRPSKEVNFHLGIYRTRKDVAAIIHHHSPFATAFAIAGKQLPLLTTPGRLIIRKVPLVEYASPGSMDLAELVAKPFSDYSVKVALLKGHGAVCIGEDLEEAIKISEWLEDAAFHAYLSSNLDGMLHLGSAPI